ncbi:MAG TPA: histidinol dehydrogenase [Candidatus Borkfalkia excrementavium]|uniref:Histidinol dehydrogenase n=1 Tax=Candidatus Borkfalkia excrementavium TaxID=2838505 RepID=A0A9D1Z944_9FIRM|nr:histidinol dehydrogenase [Candidatus Borkfalkia excrementavium]
MKMKIYENAAAAKDMLSRGGLGDEELAQKVRQIVSDVAENGDAALFSYCEKFDGTHLTPETLYVSREEIVAAYAQVDQDLLASMRKAAKNVLDYHSRSPMQGDVRESGGRTTGYVVRAVERAGIYVPGGTAPLFSSVMMGVLPAKAAGVEHIVVSTPAKNGKIAPAVIVAADLCGAEKILKAGGAQAIAALACGTQSVERVDVIAGPGNIFVTLAKKEVYGRVGIDMLAGPSEILIVADGAQDPEFVAADVLSQAEHDKLSRAILLTDSRTLAEAVQAAVERRLEKLPRREIAEYSVSHTGGIILVKDMDEACALANEIAPEHLELAVNNAEELLEKIRNAGAVFLGSYTPEPVGDYFAGPDHTLPTGGTARFFQVLNQDIFLRKMSVIRYGRKALEEDAEDIVRLAEAEGLNAHAEAVRARMKDR